MHRLAILKFCREELAERQKRDAWQGWFWGIRRKVVDYWIAVLERDLDPSTPDSGLNSDNLTPEERAAICRSHPLLVSRPANSAAALQPDRDWRVKLHHRVETYMAALKAHRGTGCTSGL